MSGNYGGTSGGGGIYLERSSDPAHLTLKRSSLRGNSADYGGAIHNSHAPANIVSCDFSRNTASTSGGAIYNEFAPAEITNCTFYGNNAAGTGGAFLNKNSSADGTNCTFSGNNAPSGSGFATTGLTSSSYITNCIFWDKGSSEIYTDAGSAKPVMEYCVVSGDITSADISGNLRSIIHDDPLLGALTDNGGRTRTCALGDGSSAIDAGKTIDAVGADQRGVSRPQGSAYDVGTYEKEVPKSGGDDTDKSTDKGDSGCSLGCAGPAGLLLLVPLAMLILKR